MFNFNPFLGAPFKNTTIELVLAKSITTDYEGYRVATILTAQSVVMDFANTNSIVVS